MPKISSYPKDTTVVDADAWIGTDSSNLSTKQFTAKNVAEYLNINAKINIGGEMFYKFTTSASPRATGTISFTAGGGSGTAFSAITTLKVAVNDMQGQVVTAFMDYLVGNNLLISQADAVSNFGHYTITAWTQSSEPDFYDLALTYIGGNSTIEDKKVYSLLQFDTTSSTGTETWQQSTLATTWNITHGLNKQPSVNVVIGDPSDNINVYPEIEYGDGNGQDLTSKITLRFQSANKGYAYLN